MKYDIMMPCFPILDVLVPMEDAFPIQAGESKIVRQVQDEAGGPANIFFAAARMGASVLPVGTVGDDDHGRFLLRVYREEGIDVSALRVQPGYATPQALCISDPAGRHAFVTMVHGELAMDRNELTARLEEARSLALTGYLLASPNLRETALALVRHARSLGRDVFFDPGPLIPQIPSDVLQAVLADTSALVLNDEEAALLSGAAGVEAAALRLSGRTAGAVVVKAGPRGCYVLHRGRGQWYPGFRVPLVDTTGAGDSFLGAFMHGWLSGWEIGAAATLANAAGAVKTAKPGSGRQVPTFGEVAALLERGGYPVPDSDRAAGAFISLAIKAHSC